jgi:hypothetical protein
VTTTSPLPAIEHHDHWAELASDSTDEAIPHQKPAVVARRGVPNPISV